MTRIMWRDAYGLVWRGAGLLRTVCGDGWTGVRCCIMESLFPLPIFHHTDADSAQTRTRCSTRGIRPRACAPQTTSPILCARRV